MKVLSRILAAILMLGCLAYISFVFGKYVLSSSLLKSIPKSDRIISAKAPVPLSPSAPQIIQPDGSPQVEMQVMPNSHEGKKPSRPSVKNDDEDNNSSASDQKTSDSDTENSDDNVDETETVTPTKHRKSRRKKMLESSDNTSQKSFTRKSSSGSSPIRRLYQSDEAKNMSPVPQPEKSTSKTTSNSRPEPTNNSGDAGSISPVPKPE